VAPAITQLEIETPSWGYGNSGTRFKVFPQPGVPRNPFEKVEDASIVARYTGVAKSIALHIPWDRVDDFSALAAFAKERGVRIGGINSNTFQDVDYKLGSLCHPSARVRSKAIAHIQECCEIARQTGSTVVKVWLADGTNYPGQDDFRTRRRYLIESLSEIYPALPSGARMFLEYKLYEPAFYHTDVQDWGQALTVCTHVGERAQVCVDTGDDDLMVGSIDPSCKFITERMTAGIFGSMLWHWSSMYTVFSAHCRSPRRCWWTSRRCARPRPAATSWRPTAFSKRGTTRTSGRC
jgi:L-rhamnose isomerase/sugar isomerase